MQLRFMYLVGESGAVSHRRSALLEELGWEGAVLDGSEPGAVLAALGASPMFSQRHILALENLEALDPGTGAAIAGADPAKATVIVARSSERAPGAKLLRSLTPVLETVQCGAGRAGNARGAVEELAALYGVKLTQRSKSVIVEAYGDEYERARSVLWQISVLGGDPGEQKVGEIIAASAPDTPPWAPLDAVAGGEAAPALNALAGLEPVVALTLIARELVAAARVVEAGVRDADAAAEVLGVNRYAARRSLRLALRLGDEGVAALWSALLRAELGVRGPDAAAELELFVGELCARR